MSGLAVSVQQLAEALPIHHTPNDHTIESPSAILTAGRQAIPTAIKTWTPAKATPASVE